MRKAVATQLPLLLLLLLLVSCRGFAEADRPLCPAGWVEAHDEGCFTFLDEEPNLSWIDANLACEKVSLPCLSYERLYLAKAGGFLAEPQR